MAKRSFLLPFAATISALASPSQATVKESLQETTSVDQDRVSKLTVEEAAEATLPNPGEQKDVLLPHGTELFQFVIERAQDGTLMSYHRSHSSHYSHRSHSSHYSSN